MTLRGRLIALEGIDGAGTTTQARSLVDWMSRSGTQAHLTSEPSGGPLGLLLREVLGHHTRAVDRAALALLFAADRVDHLREEIEPRLSRGVHVVSDRYVYSSLAYQSMDLEPGWVATINQHAPEPDLTVYLRVDPGLAASRRESRGTRPEEFETRPEQTRIAAAYDAFFGSTPQDGSWCLDPAGSSWIQRDPLPRPALLALGRRPSWAVLDGNASQDAVRDLLQKLIRETCFAP